MPQTSYTAAPAIAKNGTIASMRGDELVIARIAEGAVPFGALVVRGTGDDQCALPGASADISDNALGFAVNAGDSQSDEYADKTAVNILRSGHIYLTCVDAFSAGDAVQVGDVTGVIQATAGAGLTALAGAVFVTSGGAGDVAEIELNLVGQ